MWLQLLQIGCNKKLKFLRVAYSGNFVSARNGIQSLTAKHKNMNKLFNSISWSTYLETIAVLTIAFYALVAWKYYRSEINGLLSRIQGKTDDNRHVTSALLYDEDKGAEDHDKDLQMVSQSGAIHASLDLGQRLRDCIGSAKGKPFSPAILIPQLKRILNDFPDIASTPDRELINGLIVAECEKTGTALLSESEVDLWWSA